MVTTSLVLLGLACTPRPDPVVRTETTAKTAAPHRITNVMRMQRGTGGPRVVVLHGYGASPRGIISLMDDYAGDARVLAPQAPTPALDGWSWFPLSSTVGGPDSLGPGIARAADELAAWLAEEGVGPGDPVVVTGFSQGGMLSFALATRHPQLVSVAVPLAGMLPPDLVPTEAPSAPVPRIRAWHGGADTRVPTALAVRTVEALSAAGWDATLDILPGVAHAVPRQARARLHAAVPGGG